MTTLKPTTTAGGTTTAAPTSSGTTLKPCPVDRKIPKTLKKNQVQIKLSETRDFFFSTVSKWEAGICSTKKKKEVNQCIMEASISEALVELRQFYFDQTIKKDRKGFVLHYKTTTDDTTKLQNYIITNDKGKSIDINYYCGSVIAVITVANEYTAKKIKENEKFLSERINHFYHYKKYDSAARKKYYSIVINQIYDKTRNAYAPCPGEQDTCPKQNGIPKPADYYYDYGYGNLKELFP